MIADEDTEIIQMRRAWYGTHCRALATAIAIAGMSWIAGAMPPRPCECAVLQWNWASYFGPCDNLAIGLEADPSDTLWGKAPGVPDCAPFVGGSPCPDRRCCPQNRSGAVMCVTNALGSDPCVVESYCTLRCCKVAPYEVNEQNSCTGWRTLRCK